MSKRLPELSDSFMEQDISSNTALVNSSDYVTGLLTAMQSLKASFFTPNSLFLSLTDDHKDDKSVAILLEKATEYGFGAYLYVPFRKIGLGLEKTINLWLDIRRTDRDLKFVVEDFNLGLLTAYLLKRNWRARLNLVVMVKKSKDQEKEMASALEYMAKLITLARIPRDAQVHYVYGSFADLIDDVPRADLNILTLKPDAINLEVVRKQSDLFETSLLYTLDSGSENALA